MPYMVDPYAARSVAIWADNPANGLDYVIPVVSSSSQLPLGWFVILRLHVELASNITLK